MEHLNFKINILTTDGPQYDYLIHKLESKFTIGIVIRELGKYQRKNLLVQEKYWAMISIDNSISNILVHSIVEL